MRGNRDAFAVLVDRTHPRLVGTAGLILRDRGWAEDAAQMRLSARGVTCQASGTRSASMHGCIGSWCMRARTCCVDTGTS